MALAGEIGDLDSFTCNDCGVLMHNQVLCSAAGYYIGKACNCGPYSRLSRYYLTFTAAEQDIHTFRTR